MQYVQQNNVELIRMLISQTIIKSSQINNILFKLLNYKITYNFIFQASSQQINIAFCWKMLGDNINIKVLKAVLICLFLTIAIIVISFFRLITGSYIMGFFLFVFILWITIWKIGIMIMYPGSSAYFTSDIQTKVSIQIIKNIHHFGHCLQFTAQCLTQRKIQFQHSQLRLRDQILGSIHSMIQMLSMFQFTLSKRKSKLLDIYRRMLTQIDYKHQNHPPNIQSTQIESISDFFLHPKKIRNIEDGDKFQFLKERMKQILQLNSSLQSVAQSYSPPVKFLQLWKHRFFDQKLYEIRFGFQNWNRIFEYQVHLINNYGYVLETAVIRKSRQNIQNNHENYENNSQQRSNQQINQINSDGNTQNTFTHLRSHNSLNQNKAVLFCNPNGVYIQFFAVQNSYIKEYLKMGYQVIVWNYRGYGQSTGTPTISKSQSDATKVYNYFTQKGFKIQIVHGYSIGGVAAIGLVYKLQKLIASEQRQNQQNSLSSLGINHKNNIKMLIIDRSFSSIGNMAIQFGPTLHKIAKAVFFLDNKDLSQQFLQVSTYKMIIWDDRDEVIPDSASLKGGIFINLLNTSKSSTCRKYLKDDQQHTLNEEKSSEEIQNEVNIKLIQKFEQTIRVILKYSCQFENDKSLNANHIYEPSAEYDIKKQIEIVQHLSDHTNIQQKIINSNKNLVQEKIKLFFDHFKQIDGGGLILTASSEKLKKIMQKNEFQFSYKCKSYLMGLAYYGCIHPIDIAFSEHDIRKQQTIKKIDNFVENVQKIFNLSVQKISVAQQMELQKKIYEDDLINAIQNLINVFQNIKNFVLNNQNHSSINASAKKLGRLIAVNNGHNASLNNAQLKLFLKHIKQICFHEQLNSQTSLLAQNTQFKFNNAQMKEKQNTTKIIQYFD